MSNELTIPSIIGGRYRVVRELGRGGFGAVYLVEHSNTGDHLALKVLHGHAARDVMALERFKREARASARIKSENVVKVTDADAAPELDGAAFLVMELLDGKDIQKLAEARGALLPEEVVGLLTQAARALDKAHALGIVHRDLKPENMFLHRRDDGSTVLKILDFGISKSVTDLGGDMAHAGMTGTGAVIGTPLYMSPEQARGLSSQMTHATDIWAIGLVAFRLLTGNVYWTANTLADLLVHIVAFEMPAPSTRATFLPVAFDVWFARSCARNPAQRFGSVGEQVQALASALAVEHPVLPPLDLAVTYEVPAAAIFPMRREPQAGRSTTSPMVNTRGSYATRGTPLALQLGAGALLVAVLGVGVYFASLSSAFHRPTRVLVASSAPPSVAPAVVSSEAEPVASVLPPPTASLSSLAASGPATLPLTSPPRLIRRSATPLIQTAPTTASDAVPSTSASAKATSRRFDPDAP